MAKISLSASQIVNLVLGGALLLGGTLTYKYSNFGGVSFDELTEQYISKSDVKFSDLPLDVQKRYIDKEATIEKSKEGNLLDDEYRDENGKLVPESELSAQDYKRMINRLQKTLLFLQHDNLLIANEKNELSKKLEEQQNEIEEQQKNFNTKNTERLNEAEQQHYRNISDLTMKINELQKENVVISQKANIEANTLKNQIDELKSNALAEEEKKQLAIKKAREEEQAKLGDYKDKIKLLNDQIALLNEQINTNNETAKTAFMRKQDEINKLKDELVLASKEKNDMISRQTQALLLTEQKHKEEIAKYASTIEQLKSDTEKLISKNRQDLATQEQDYLKKMATQEEKIKGLNNELASAKKYVDSLMLENEKDFNKFKTYLEDEKRLNKELTAANKKLEENAQTIEKNLNISILKLKEDLAKKDVTIKELGDKIIALNNAKIDVEAEIKRKVDENDRVHNKNYKIFNEKIATFEVSKKELVDKLDKQLNEYKATVKENNERIQFHVNELTTANNDLKSKNDEKERELQSLKNQIVMSKVEYQKSREGDESKLKELKAALDEIKTQQKQKEGDYIAKIQILEADIKEKENQIATAKKDETLKIAALEKEIKTKAIEAQKIRDENARHESTLKTLQVKLKDAEDATLKITNKQIDDLKAKVAEYEKNRVHEDSKMVSLKDELRRKEIEYLDALKEKDKELKAKEAVVGSSKEETKKVEALKLATEDKIAKLKEEMKQKEFQYLESIKALQTDLKAKESQLAAGAKDETLKSLALEKELKAKETQLALAKEEVKKIEAQKMANEEKLAKLKEESKQQQLQQFEATKALQADIKAKDAQLGSSKKDEALKVLALEKELKQKEQAQEELNKRLASSEQTIKTLNEKIKLLEVVTPKVATKSTSTKAATKLAAVDKVICTDMGTGVNAISETCKKEVQTFLSKYDNSYFFEVTPIVDNGGFASLKLIKSKKVGVEDSEIDRITGLANIGLGKARAKAGGDLVETYIGEGAKISYSLTNIEQDKARGFQIKVYQ